VSAYLRSEPYRQNAVCTYWILSTKDPELSAPGLLEFSGNISASTLDIVAKGELYDLARFGFKKRCRQYCWLMNCITISSNMALFVHLPATENQISTSIDIRFASALDPGPLILRWNSRAQDWPDVIDHQTSLADVVFAPFHNIQTDSRCKN